MHVATNANELERATGLVNINYEINNSARLGKDDASGTTALPLLSARIYAERVKRSSCETYFHCYERTEPLSLSLSLSLSLQVDDASVVSVFQSPFGLCFLNAREQVRTIRLSF